MSVIIGIILCKEGDLDSEERIIIENSLSVFVSIILYDRNVGWVNDIKY